MEPTLAVSPKRFWQSRRFRSLFFGLIILLSGMCIGGGITLVFVGKQIQNVLKNPNIAAERIAQRMTRRLDLTVEQSQKVQDILESGMDHFQDIRKRVIPEIDEELNRIDREVTAVLTPEQTQHWNKQFNRLRDLWLSTHPMSK